MEACTFVVFGATGHLARTKLLPAMYHLEEAGRVPENTAIIGFSRKAITDDNWKTQIHELLEKRARGGVNQDVVNRLCERVHSIQGDMIDAESLKQINEHLAANPHLPKNIVFYMAIPPHFYSRVAQALSQIGLNNEEYG